MAIADYLQKIGHGLEEGVETAGRVAGAVAEPLGKSVAETLSGEAPQIHAEKRQHAQQLSDEQRQNEINDLEKQLDEGRKYGTLTTEQQKQYTDAIARHYSDPSQMGTLIQKLHKATHPGGATYQPYTPQLADPTPQGGTAATDTAAKGAKTGTKPLPGVKPFKAPDGKWYQPMYNAQGEVVNEPVEGYSGAPASQIRQRISTTGNLLPNDAQDENGDPIKNRDEESVWQRDPMDTSKWIQIPGTWQKTVIGNREYRLNPQTGQVELVSGSNGEPLSPVSLGHTSIDQYGNVTATTPETAPLPSSQSAAPVVPSTGAKRVGPILGGSPKVHPVTAHLGGVKVPASQGKASVDANGHIPSSAGNPQVVELANELLDGRDAKELPMKARAAAEEMARKYGWEQGTFTPKEKVLINEATAKIEQLKDSKSLDVLNNTVSREKIAAVLHGTTGKPGMLGTILSAGMAGHLNPQEREFLRLYNATVGVVSGLAPITRGGRTVEASINRLMQELPSVLQSGSSEDAKKRLDQLLQEVKVAEQTNGTTPMGGAAGALGGAIQIQRDANGNITGVN